MRNFDINEVLDLIKNRQGLKSDYKLGLYLGITNGSVRNFRHGRSLPDERICKLLAAAAGIDPLILAAQVQAQRSKTEEARSLWEQIAERLQMAAQGAVAAVFAVAIAIGLIAQSADESWAGEVPTPKIQESAVYTSYLVRRY
ncbi:hypothetical protein AVHY2522_22850 [Acidovorax sp. SUPP2522]|uniref:DUF3693 domain-containing protein n=1 Tax=unclassified Acidovorax TaxID=2684926 RepID=UPI00234B853F|nr:MULTISPECIES: DUF3693 domain-containing protein [unclassified Acidovorax]WCM95734.1 DUF3693 domain-containing protein [Acidovorax sp. GBBC 1281]GKT19540.1 hypothetical protein AVHY2522_22850 [Acidovorax sp. SUPP2522]